MSNKIDTLKRQVFDVEITRKQEKKIMLGYLGLS